MLLVQAHQLFYLLQFLLQCDKQALLFWKENCKLLVQESTKSFKVHLFYLYRKLQLLHEALFCGNLDRSFLGLVHLLLVLYQVCSQLSILDRLCLLGNYKHQGQENFDFMTNDAFLPSTI